MFVHLVPRVFFMQKVVKQDVIRQLDLIMRPLVTVIVKVFFATVVVVSM